METLEPLPKWMMRRYAALWRDFGTGKFTLQEAIVALKEEEGILLAMFSKMRKSGWLLTEATPSDGRKRVYALLPVETALELI